MPARLLGSRGLCAAAWLLVAVAGCSSGVRGSDRAGGWYTREELPRFATETAAPYVGALDPEYVIGVGDELEVVFLFHSNLTTRDLIVRRDGRISLPHVGDQMAAGVTPMTLDSILTTRFAEILRDPNLSVIVNQSAPQKIFVLGEVAIPGKYQYADEVTLVQSVAMAGGLKPGAQADHAVLIRRQGVSKIVGIEVDLEAIISGAALQNDIRLRNYDILYIPQHPIYSAAEFMTAVNEILIVPLDLVFRGWSIANLSASYEFFQKTRPTP